MELQHAVERMDHFPGEDLFVTRTSAFAALQALVAERGADELLVSVPALAEVRHDVGRQVVGLLTAEAMFVGALAAASATRRRGSPAVGPPHGFETLAGAVGLDAGATASMHLASAAAAAPVLPDLLRFAAARLASAATRTDPRLGAALETLTQVALREVQRGAAAELFLAAGGPP